MIIIIKIAKIIISILGVAIFFSPLYLPLIYEPYRPYYHIYEILIYVGSLLVLGFIFTKLDKKNIR
jgi:hypothetical protein